jgi:hypothetical protein
MALLKSDWGSLSPHLMATWFPVKMQQDGNTRSFRAFGDTQVMAPITDANLEQTQNWTSPFENMTADSGMSTFSAMLQVGGFGAILNALQKHVPNGSAADSALSAAQEQANSLTGSTSITKLNSTQIYNGSPPLKITLTAHFRALRDPVKEPAHGMVHGRLPGARWLPDELDRIGECGAVGLPEPGAQHHRHDLPWLLLHADGDRVHEQAP